ncbi:pyridoxal-phosphate dependent enzyme [Luteimonas sp. SX5]|uniref:Pyridoxal-phosphate dependent enzyme n=1 Tax=Luteimonas galliterrae TaxID=2940486 RepID=A0ABT0MLS2_9GAMM|nr:pyridoxal-phosphate dependent enzyme [Luteimonas galliterrae]MCL1635834.1 pyridoxal-phosphate dependent enzyme [Luteimonas galliterrae]
MTRPRSDLDAASLSKEFRRTPLLELPELARRAGVGRVFVKSEGERPLGNFKSLGGMFAGLRALARHAGVATLAELYAQRAALPRLICASDGNHGLAVAAAAARAGAKASIYLPTEVARSRAVRIQAYGGDVVRVAGTYDDAVDAAAAAAANGEGLLIADTGDDPDDAVVKDVMSGYGLIARELVVQFRDQVRDRPSHVFVQAGVGGLAAAMAEGLRDLLQAPRKLLVVEPASAACVAHALASGHAAPISGDLRTSAGMLSCGRASAVALPILQRHGAHCIKLAEHSLRAAPAALREAGGPETTPSGAAGVAGLLHVAAQPALRAAHRLDVDSRVLLLATEAAIAD